MIVDWFLDVALNVVSWIGGLMVMPGGGVDFITGAGVAFAHVFSNIAGLGAWVPWPFVVLVVGSIFALWAILALVKFVTWLKGLFWASS